jgi:hypothetical protein
MKQNEKNETEKGNEFMETMLGIAQQALNQPSPMPGTICVNQSRNLNHIKVDIHVVSQPQPGFFRRLFSKLF